MSMPAVREDVEHSRSSGSTAANTATAAAAGIPTPAVHGSPPVPQLPLLSSLAAADRLDVYTVYSSSLMNAAPKSGAQQRQPGKQQQAAEVAAVAAATEIVRQLPAEQLMHLLPQQLEWDVLSEDLASSEPIGLSGLKLLGLLLQSPSAAQQMPARSCDQLLRVLVGAMQESASKDRCKLAMWVLTTQQLPAGRLAGHAEALLGGLARCMPLDSKPWRSNLVSLQAVRAVQRLLRQLPAETCRHAAKWGPALWPLMLAVPPEGAQPTKTDVYRQLREEALALNDELTAAVRAACSRGSAPAGVRRSAATAAAAAAADDGDDKAATAAALEAECMSRALRESLAARLLPPHERQQQQQRRKEKQQQQQGGDGNAGGGAGASGGGSSSSQEKGMLSEMERLVARVTGQTKCSAVQESAAAAAMAAWGSCVRLLGPAFLQTRGLGQRMLDLVKTCFTCVVSSSLPCAAFAAWRALCENFRDLGDLPAPPPPPPPPLSPPTGTAAGAQGGSRGAAVKRGDGGGGGGCSSTGLSRLRLLIAPIEHTICHERRPDVRMAALVCWQHLIGFLTVPYERLLYDSDADLGHLLPYLAAAAAAVAAKEPPSAEGLWSTGKPAAPLAAAAAEAEAEADSRQRRCALGAGRKAAGGEAAGAAVHEAAAASQPAWNGITPGVWQMAVAPIVKVVLTNAVKTRSAAAAVAAVAPHHVAAVDTVLQTLLSITCPSSVQDIAALLAATLQPQPTASAPASPAPSAVTATASGGVVSRPATPLSNALAVAVSSPQSLAAAATAAAACPGSQPAAAAALAATLDPWVTLLKEMFSCLAAKTVAAAVRAATRREAGGGASAAAGGGGGAAAAVGDAVQMGGAASALDAGWQAWGRLAATVLSCHARKPAAVSSGARQRGEGSAEGSNAPSGMSCLFWLQLCHATTVLAGGAPRVGGGAAAAAVAAAADSDQVAAATSTKGAGGAPCSGGREDSVPAKVEQHRAFLCLLRRLVGPQVALLTATLLKLPAAGGLHGSEASLTTTTTAGAVAGGSGSGMPGVLWSQAVGQWLSLSRALDPLCVRDSTDEGGSRRDGGSSSAEELRTTEAAAAAATSSAAAHVEQQSWWWQPWKSYLAGLMGVLCAGGVTNVRLLSSVCRAALQPPQPGGGLGDSCLAAAGGSGGDGDGGMFGKRRRRSPSPLGHSLLPAHLRTPAATPSPPPSPLPSHALHGTDSGSTAYTTPACPYAWALWEAAARHLAGWPSPGPSAPPCGPQSAAGHWLPSEGGQGSNRRREEAAWAAAELLTTPLEALLLPYQARTAAAESGVFSGGTRASGRGGSLAEEIRCGAVCGNMTGAACVDAGSVSAAWEGLLRALLQHSRRAQQGLGGGAPGSERPDAVQVAVQSVAVRFVGLLHCRNTALRSAAAAAIAAGQTSAASPSGVADTDVATAESGGSSGKDSAATTAAAAADMAAWDILTWSLSSSAATALARSLTRLNETTAFGMATTTSVTRAAENGVLRSQPSAVGGGGCRTPLRNGVVSSAPVYGTPRGGSTAVAGGGGGCTPLTGRMLRNISASAAATLAASTPATSAAAGTGALPTASPSTATELLAALASAATAAIMQQLGSSTACGLGAPSLHEPLRGSGGVARAAADAPSCRQKPRSAPLKPWFRSPPAEALAEALNAIPDVLMPLLSAATSASPSVGADSAAVLPGVLVSPTASADAVLDLLLPPLMTIVEELMPALLRDRSCAAAAATNAASPAPVAAAAAIAAGPGDVTSAQGAKNRQTSISGSPHHLVGLDAGSAGGGDGAGGSSGLAAVHVATAVTAVLGLLCGLRRRGCDVTAEVDRLAPLLAACLRSGTRAAQPPHGIADSAPQSPQPPPAAEEADVLPQATCLALESLLTGRMPRLHAAVAKHLGRLRLRQQHETYNTLLHRNPATAVAAAAHTSGLQLLLGRGTGGMASGEMTAATTATAAGSGGFAPPPPPLALPLVVQRAVDELGWDGAFLLPDSQLQATTPLRLAASGYRTQQAQQPTPQAMHAYEHTPQPGKAPAAEACATAAAGPETSATAAMPAAGPPAATPGAAPGRRGARTPAATPPLASRGAAKRPFCDSQTEYVRIAPPPAPAEGMTPSRSPKRRRRFTAVTTYTGLDGSQALPVGLIGEGSEDSQGGHSTEGGHGDGGGERMDVEGAVHMQQHPSTTSGGEAVAGAGLGGVGNAAEAIMGAAVTSGEGGADADVEAGMQEIAQIGRQEVELEAAPAEMEGEGVAAATVPALLHQLAAGLHQDTGAAPAAVPVRQESPGHRAAAPIPASALQASASAAAATEADAAATPSTVTMSLVAHARAARPGTSQEATRSLTPATLPACHRGPVLREDNNDHGGGGSGGGEPQRTAVNATQHLPAPGTSLPHPPPPPPPAAEIAASASRTGNDPDQQPAQGRGTHPAGAGTHLQSTPRPLPHQPQPHFPAEQGPQQHPLAHPSGELPGPQHRVPSSPHPSRHAGDQAVALPLTAVAAPPPASMGVGPASPAAGRGRMPATGGPPPAPSEATLPVHDEEPPPPLQHPVTPVGTAGTQPLPQAHDEPPSSAKPLTLPRPRGPYSRVPTPNIEEEEEQEDVYMVPDSLDPNGHCHPYPGRASPTAGLHEAGAEERVAVTAAPVAASAARPAEDGLGGDLQPSRMRVGERRGGSAPPPAPKALAGGCAGAGRRAGGGGGGGGAGGDGDASAAAEHAAAAAAAGTAAAAGAAATHGGAGVPTALGGAAPAALAAAAAAPAATEGIFLDGASQLELEPGPTLLTRSSGRSSAQQQTGPKKQGQQGGPPGDAGRSGNALPPPLDPVRVGAVSERPESQGLQLAPPARRHVLLQTPGVLALARTVPQQAASGQVALGPEAEAAGQAGVVAMDGVEELVVEATQLQDQRLQKRRRGSETAPSTATTPAGAPAPVRHQQQPQQPLQLAQRLGDPAPAAGAAWRPASAAAASAATPSAQLPGRNPYGAEGRADPRVSNAAAQAVGAGGITAGPAAVIKGLEEVHGVSHFTGMSMHELLRCSQLLLEMQGRVNAEMQRLQQVTLHGEQQQPQNPPATAVPPTV